MSLPEIVSREQWIAKRRELLAREKQQTAERDALNAHRRRLPMVEIIEPYVFEGPDGPAGLFELFKGYRQLVIQHFMFDPSWDEGCPSCTASIDEFSVGLLNHLRSRQTNFAVVSRAPLEKLLAYKEKHGWTIDWYSSLGSEFNYDFNVTIDASKRPGDVQLPGRRRTGKDRIRVAAGS